MPPPPIILIHGYPFDRSLWDWVVTPLTLKTQVLTPDLPGFGNNPAETAEPSIDVMADAIAGLFELHDINVAVVAGMSMGGYVALSFAERHPGRLAGLGLISTQAIADTDEIREARRKTIELIRQDGAPAAATLAIPKLFAPANRKNAALTRFPIESATRAGVEGLSWALQAMAARPDRTAVLPQIRVPSLVLHGTEDGFIPTERARQMAEQLPNGRYVEVRGAGHALPLEAPKEVAEALSELIDRAAVAA